MPLVILVDQPQPFFPRVALCLLWSAILATGVGCGGVGGGSSPQQQTVPNNPQSQVATPSFQPSGGTISTGYPNIVISDSTVGVTIHYTTDGAAPTANSPVYSAPFTITTPVTVQALATASGYAESAVAAATYKFQTPSGTFTITLTPTAVAAGSSKAISPTPISLTLTVK